MKSNPISPSLDLNQTSFKEKIRPKKIQEAANFLISQKLYKDEGITSILNTNWREISEGHPLLDYIEIEDEILSNPVKSKQSEAFKCYGGQITINDEFVSIDDNEAEEVFETTVVQKTN